MPRLSRALSLTLTLLGPGLVAAAGSLCALPSAALPLAAARAEEGAVEPRLRVLLHEGPSLRLAALDGAGLRVRDGQGRRLRDLPGARPLQLTRNGAWLELSPIPVDPAPPATAPASAAATPLTAAPLTAPPMAAAPEPAAAAPLLRVAADDLWIEALPTATGLFPGLAVQQRSYRGRVQVLVRGGNLLAINQVPIEAYLPSVVGSEMPASWPQQALRAQAVAARTYALKGRRPSALFDLQASVASQMYRGMEAETPSTREAVRATRGLVLTYGDGLIDAVFHSSSGGSTESSGELWPRQLPYLLSVPDFDHDSPVHHWRQPLPPDLLARSFREIGGVRRIEVVSTTSTGRVRQARVVGPTGELMLSGAALRSRLGLRSTWVRFELELPPSLSPDAAPALVGAAQPAFSLPAEAFEPPATLPPLPLPQWVAVGRGFGHGIGMSQWGAFAMARRGESFETILRHYYRGVSLRPYRELAVAAAAAPGSGRAQVSEGDADVVASGPRR